MTKEIICFSANRTCHHDDYFSLINNIQSSKNIKKFLKKISILFTNKSIVYFDIDGLDLFFTPLIILRSIWGAKGLGISVRTEYLLESRNFHDLIFKRNRLIFLKSVTKKILFFCVNNFSKTKIISIHKNQKNNLKLKQYINDFIYDPQLWDLELLNIKSIKPIELETFNFDDKKIILVAGRLNEQRSKQELFNFLEKQSKFNFVLAGEMLLNDFIKLKHIPNCFLINRFVTNEELIYLMTNSNLVYCFYTNDRPSGFFGRGIQLGKPVIVRKFSYLDSMFNEYKKQISINHLDELINLNVNEIENQINEINHYNDINKLKSFITSL